MGRHETFRWTDEMIAALTTMWANGATFLQIATAFGVSRGMISGKVDRLGLPKRGGRRAVKPKEVKRAPSIIPTELTRVEKAARQQVNHIARVLGITPHVPQARPRDLTILDLRHGECRYAINDDPPYLFCGEVVQDGSSYCATHHAECYQRAGKSSGRPTNYAATWRAA